MLKLISIFILLFVCFTNATEIEQLLISNSDSNNIADSIQTKTNNIKRFPSGIGISLGLGYNQLFWDTHNTNDPDPSTIREAFSLTPTIRLQYNARINRFTLFKPFIEYNIFGGKSATEPNGYLDKYWFYVIGGGANFNYTYSHCEFGLGFKFNYILKAIGYNYGGFTDSSSSTRSWDQTDWTDDFPKISIDIGPSIGYSLSHFTISTECWFGLSDLLKRSFFQQNKSMGWASAYEFHYRFIVTYNIP
jgi:hypothetical protein